MNKHTETYLGDGLYASDDGFMVTLRAPRDEGDHWVGLEPDVLKSFFDYVARVRGLEITVTKKETERRSDADKAADGLDEIGDK